MKGVPQWRGIWPYPWFSLTTLLKFRCYTNTFRVSTCMFKNDTTRVLQKVLLRLPASIYTPPYWCRGNTWNTESFVVAMQLLDSSDCTIWTNFGNILYIFVPVAQSNKDNKTLQAQTWLLTIKLLTYTVLLNLKIVCHLAKLNSINNYSKTIDVFHFILAYVDNYQ